MAQDETLVRQSNVRAQIAAVEQIIQGINTLLDKKAERDKFETPFQDSDFAPTDLTHLTAALVGTFDDFVIPAFTDFLTDTTDGGRNGQLLEQMRNS